MMRPYRAESIFELACPCGRLLVAPGDAGEVTCGDCGRLGVIVW
jgi:hypothetical protein